MIRLLILMMLPSLCWASSGGMFPATGGWSYLQTYDLTLTITDSDGDDTVTVDGTAHTSSGTITGLDSATETLTGGFGSTGTNDTVVCTGTAVGGTAPNYTIDMSDSNESATCTFSTASSALFDWDCETATADISGGTLTGTVSSDATLSTTYAVSPTHSLAAPTSYDNYTFANSTIFDNEKGVLTFHIRGNYDTLGGIKFVYINGDGSNNISGSIISNNKAQFYWNATGSSIYMFSSATDGLGTGWNTIELTYDNSTGSTVWSMKINGSADGSGSDADVWDSSVDVVNVALGTASGDSPSSTVYLDDIKFESGD